MQASDTGEEPDKESASGRGKRGRRGATGRGRAGRRENTQAAQPSGVSRGRGRRQAGVPALVPEEGIEQRQAAHDEQMQVIINTIKTNANITLVKLLFRYVYYMCYCVVLCHYSIGNNIIVMPCGMLFALVL